MIKHKLEKQQLNSNDNNNYYNKITISISLRNKIFLLTFLLGLVLISLFTWSELNRWHKLTESYINEKGTKLIRTINPLIQNFILSNDIKKLDELAKSLTDTNIKDNDIISVHISNSDKKTIVNRNSPNRYRQGPFLFFPPSIVIEEDLTDEKVELIGFIQMAF